MLSTPAGFDMRDQDYIGAPAALAAKAAPELYGALARFDHYRRVLWIEVWWRDPRLTRALQAYALAAAQAGVEQWRHLPEGYQVRVVSSRRRIEQATRRWRW